MMNKSLNISFLFKEEDSKNGLFTAPEILNYHRKLDTGQANNTSKMFNHLSERRDVDISNIYTDRFGVDYVYVKVSFHMSKGGKKFKVITFPNFELFIEMLFDQGLTCRYEEIIQHAEKLMLEKEDDDVIIKDNKAKKLEMSQTKIGVNV